MESDTKKTIYLGGPIEGVSPRWATEWRWDVKFSLSGLYDFIDPTFGKDLTQPNVHTNVYTPEEIVGKDYDGVSASDILLVDLRVTPFLQRLNNFIRTGHSDPARVGTIMEIVFAWVHGLDIIAFGMWNFGYFMRYHVDHFFPTLYEAVEYLRDRERVIH